MRNNLYCLIIFLSIFFCSCEKSTENPYVPEVLEDNMHSGAGYARNFTANSGELIFTLSRPSAGTETLSVRGCGKAEADILINGQHYPVAFRTGGGIWDVVNVSVQFSSGLNTITLTRTDGGKTGMWIDYIEIQ